MFLQVKVIEDHAAQRILYEVWKEVDHLMYTKFKLYSFGATCSPCVAQEAKYPGAVKAIISQRYTDDYLGG